MSKTIKIKTYQNGQELKKGDHTAVREILATGLVKRVFNFGPLLDKKSTRDFQNIDGMKKITKDGFDLFVKNEDTVSFLDGDFQLKESKDVSIVYYQRISK